MYELIVSEDVRQNDHSWVSHDPAAAVAVWGHCLLSVTVQRILSLIKQCSQCQSVEGRELF